MALLCANRHEERDRMRQTVRPAAVSAAIYTTISLAAAAAFFVATTVTGDYTWVARIGGAGWVLLLSFIISMPTVTPWVKRRLATEDGHPAHATAGVGGGASSGEARDV
jgi:hypothetical protein